MNAADPMPQTDDRLQHDDPVDTITSLWHAAGTFGPRPRPPLPGPTHEELVGRFADLFDTVGFLQDEAVLAFEDDPALAMQALRRARDHVDLGACFTKALRIATGAVQPRLEDVPLPTLLKGLLEHDVPTFTASRPRIVLDIDPGTSVRVDPDAFRAAFLTVMTDPRLDEALEHRLGVHWRPEGRTWGRLWLETGATGPPPPAGPVGGRGDRAGMPGDVPSLEWHAGPSFAVSVLARIDGDVFGYRGPEGREGVVFGLRTV